MLCQIFLYIAITRVPVGPQVVLISCFEPAHIVVAVGHQVDIQHPGLPTRTGAVPTSWGHGAQRVH